MTKRYHYRISGLDNVYLSGDGVQIREGKYGKTVSIANIDQLHQLIAADIAKRNIDLTGKELRFLRVQLDLSQTQFAGLIGSTKQNVGRYERDELKEGIPGSIQMAARMLYLTYTEHPQIKKIITDLAELDRQLTGDRVFRSEGDGWEEGDGCAQ